LLETVLGESQKQKQSGATVKSFLEQEAETARSIGAQSEIFAGPLRVADVMTQDATTLDATQSFTEVVSLMATRSFHHVLVVDTDDRLRGVISDRDVLRALSRTPNWNTKTVSEIMTQEPVTTTPESMISDAARRMLAMRINCLPVIGADGRVCGIVTSTDLLKAYEIIQSLVEKHHILRTTRPKE
jgi:acetoin utilization protein AcuB